MKPIILFTFSLIFSTIACRNVHATGNPKSVMPDTITDQQFIELTNEGIKSYKQIQELCQQEEYTKAIEVYEENKGNLLCCLDNSNEIFMFHEIIIKLYQKTSDETKAIEKAISLREFNKTYMEGVMAFGGQRPDQFFRNSNLLSCDYLQQKDYSNAIKTMYEICEILKSEGDTLSIPFAIVSANMGYILKKVFYEFFPTESKLSDMPDDAITIAEGAISYYIKANEIYNTMPDMKYSNENAEVLLGLIDICQSLYQDSLIIQYTEQIQNIYDKNNWEREEDYH